MTHKPMTWFRPTLFLCALILGGNPASGLAASCVDQGCHQPLTETRYLHGPVAAELAGAKGCIMCHHPSGVACASSKAGEFTTKHQGMCLLCHEKGTGTQHSAAGGNCLQCHDPHGSETSPFMVRDKK